MHAHNTVTDHPESKWSAEPLLTLEEVCRHLRISVHTGRKLVRDGRLRGFVNGGIRRFTRSHIDAFLDERTCEGSDSTP